MIRGDNWSDHADRLAAQATGADLVSFFLPCEVTKVGQMIVTKSQQEEKMGSKKENTHYPIAPRIAQTELGTQEVQWGKWQGNKQQNHWIRRATYTFDPRRAL